MFMYIYIPYIPYIHIYITLPYICKYHLASPVTCEQLPEGCGAPGPDHAHQHPQPGALLRDQASAFLVQGYEPQLYPSHVPRISLLSPSSLQRGALLLQGYLAHKKHPPPRNLQKHMPRAIWWSWGGREFL